MSSVGSFFSYVNDARSHEPEVCSVAMVSADIPPLHPLLHIMGLAGYYGSTVFTGCARHEPERFSKDSLLE